MANYVLKGNRIKYGQGLFLTKYQDILEVISNENQVFFWDVILLLFQDINILQMLLPILWYLIYDLCYVVMVQLPASQQIKNMYSYMHVSGNIFWIASLQIIHECKPGCEHVCFRNIYKNREQYLFQKKRHLCCTRHEIQILICSTGLNLCAQPTSVIAIEKAENPRKSK